MSAASCMPPSNTAIRGALQIDLVENATASDSDSSIIQFKVEGVVLLDEAKMRLALPTARDVAANLPACHEVML